MTSLEDLQRAAQRHLLGGGAMPAELAAALAPPAEERWGIYVEAYRLRLTEALATTYRTLAARLGREAFAPLAGDFIGGYPSTFRSLRDYGGDFPAWLAARADDPESRLCAELASFEWLLAAAFDAPGARATSVADLAAIEPSEWPELRFRAVPGLGRLRTTTNAVVAWRACRTTLEDDSAAGPLPDPPAEDGATTDWVILRPALETQFRSLLGDEAEALDLLLAGASFAALGEALGARHGEGAALAAATWLKGWLTEGALQRV